MDDNGTYLTVRSLQRAGHWDLAARLAPDGSALRADVLTDRYLWRLDRVDETLAAIAAVADEHPDLAAYLTAQIEYWRQLGDLERNAGGGLGGGLDSGLSGELGGEPVAGDPVDTFAGLRSSAELGGWATFWHAVSMDKLRGDGFTAATGYAAAQDLAVAAGDLLLESYAVRHLGGQALEAGDPRRAIPLARRSLQLRATLGARPQVAAAQALLAAVLESDANSAHPDSAHPDSAHPNSEDAKNEAEELKIIFKATAAELGLAWLLKDA